MQLEEDVVMVRLVQLGVLPSHVAYREVVTVMVIHLNPLPLPELKVVVNNKCKKINQTIIFQN